MSNATAPEPHRNLNAGFHERTTGSRIEFDHWRKAHPDFTSAELLANWRRIRVAWGLTHDHSDRKPARR